MQKKVHRKLNKKALLVIVLTLYLFIMAFYYCFNLPIKSIVIKGNTNTLDEEIIKLGNINSYNRILRIAKDFVARRWFMNASNYNFPVDKCDFYGVVDNRNISKKDWYKSETGINQVMKEFINIGDQTINKELSIR